MYLHTYRVIEKAPTLSGVLSVGGIQSHTYHQNTPYLYRTGPERQAIRRAPLRLAPASLEHTEVCRNWKCRQNTERQAREDERIQAGS